MTSTGTLLFNLYRNINLKIILSYINFDFITQSFYWISQNDVDVEYRNNDTVMGYRKGLEFWQCSSPYHHVFAKYERGKVLLASAITTNISSRTYGWISFLVLAPYTRHKPSCLPTQLLTTLADNPWSASVIPST